MPIDMHPAPGRVAESSDISVGVRMRAGIWTGTGSMELGEVDEPTCPADGALIRVVACGICGTDVRVFYNGDRRIEAPWILGHEISGELVALGREAERDTEHRVGDLVHLIS